MKKNKIYKDLTGIFKRKGLFYFLRRIILNTAIIYFLVLIVFLIVTRDIIISPVLAAIPVIFIFLVFIFPFLNGLIFSPSMIFLTTRDIKFDFPFKKSLSINLDDILYVKNKITIQRSGNYYNDTFFLVLKNKKTYSVNLYMFQGNDLNQLKNFLLKITNKYNQNQTEYFQKNRSEFRKKYTKNMYIFYQKYYKIFLFTFFFLIITGILLLISKNNLGFIFFIICAIILVLPVKIEIFPHDKRIIFKNILNMRIKALAYSSVKAVTITNTLSVSIIFSLYNDKNNKKKKKGFPFQLTEISTDNKREILELLFLIFESKISFNLRGIEPLL